MTVRFLMLTLLPLGRCRYYYILYILYIIIYINNIIYNKYIYIYLFIKYRMIGVVVQEGRGGVDFLTVICHLSLWGEKRDR